MATSVEAGARIVRDYYQQVLDALEHAMPCPIDAEDRQHRQDLRVAIKELDRIIGG